MEISSNPSALINALEYNLYKGVSRSKIDNQQKMEACILETDKITEQKSAAYRTEAVVMVACAVGLIALAALGVAIEWKIESIKSDLNNLSSINLNNLSPKQRIGLKYTIESLGNTQKKLNTCKSVFNIFNILLQKGPECSSSLLRVSINRLEHQYKKQDMRWSQLNQDRSNSANQNLLNEVKEARKNHQQSRTTVT